MVFGLLCTLLGSSSPLMPLIPIPRRVRSFHGPHTTCMHSACGSTHTSQLVRTKYNNFDLYLRSRCMYSFLRFLLYFGCSLLTSLLWVALSTLFFSAVHQCACPLAPAVQTIRYSASARAPTLGLWGAQRPYHLQHADYNVSGGGSWLVLHGFC